MSPTWLVVNGKRRTVTADPDMPLLWVLRDVMGMTGTKFGCGIAQCGACTVHLEGAAVRSCSVPLSAAAGKHVTTIEGLSPNRAPRAPAGMDRARRAAVRLLPVRPAHVGGGAARRATPRPPTPTSTPRWTATSAAAEPTSAFAPRSTARRRRPDMSADVSRREFVKAGAASRASWWPAAPRLCPDGRGRGSPAPAPTLSPSAFLQIAARRQRHVLAHRSPRWGRASARCSR